MVSVTVLLCIGMVAATMSTLGSAWVWATKSLCCARILFASCSGLRRLDRGGLCGVYGVAPKPRLGQPLGGGSLSHTLYRDF